MRRGPGGEASLRRRRGPARLWVAVAALIIGTIWLCSSSSVGLFGASYRIQVVDINKLWRTTDSNGWRASSAPRTYWPPPPTESESNGYLRVRCNGGLNQQRSAICNAVVAARIMNATLVLPELDTNSFWHDESGFVGIYDVPHFIKTLKYDVRIVMGIPEITANGKTKKLKAHQIRPPRDAPVSWYATDALEMMKKYGAIYLTPFSHRLAEDIDDPELQRLRCRVNYHALRFKPHIMKTSSEIVSKLRSEGHYMSIHLRFELDMLAFAGCIDIFTPQEQKILVKYRTQHFAYKVLIPGERRLIGKCPLTPEEVGLILRAMGFDNTTRIYLASGELFGGKRFMKPFRSMFPRLENHSTVGPGKLEENTRGLAGSAVDYMVCLLSDIFIPTYDGPSNFANNLMGHRLYYGFRTTITPNRKALAPILIDRMEGRTAGFEEGVRRVMFNMHFGGPHKRIHPESFYTNSWPECFCAAVTRAAGRCEAFWAEDISDDSFVFFLGHTAPKLRSLRLISCTFSTRGLNGALRNFPVLEELELSLCSGAGATASGFCDLGETCAVAAEACPLLERLRLNKYRFHRLSGIGDSEATAIARTRGLRSLQLFGNSLSDAGLAAILGGCVRLESLDIRHCFNVNVKDETRAMCARLKTLRLPDDSMDGYDLAFGSPEIKPGRAELGFAVPDSPEMNYGFRGDILWDSW